MKTDTPAFRARRRNLIAIAGAAAWTAMGGLAGAAEPATTFWVPWPAGGPGDVIARQMLPTLRSSLNRQVIVENLGGVSGALAVQRMLSGPRDGSSFLIGTPSEVILAPLALSAVRYQPEQLAMVGMASTAAVVLVGGPHLAAKTLAELVSSGRAAGAKPYSYGSSGVGTISHLVAEDFAQRAKLRTLHIPYKGTAPVLQDLIGGQIDLAFVAYGGSVPGFIQDGRLRAYGIAQGSRRPGLPAAPSIAEVLGEGPFEYEIWGGIFMPRGAPQAAMERLNSAIHATLQDTTFRQQTEASGGAIGRSLTLAEADAFMKAETAKYQRIAHNLKLERQ